MTGKSLKNQWKFGENRLHIQKIDPKITKKPSQKVKKNWQKWFINFGNWSKTIKKIVKKSLKIEWKFNKTELKILIFFLMFYQFISSFLCISVNFLVKFKWILTILGQFSKIFWSILCIINPFTSKFLSNFLFLTNYFVF